jgi:Glycerophosphoryl diester phosphodiesterase family
VPELPALRRVGHKGADHIAPGNTAASFDAALAHGVDMIEFDVLPDDDGRLVLAHDREHLPGAMTLEEGLDHLAPTAVELDVDLKLPGYEERVVEALRAHGLVARSLVSTQYMRSLVAIRDLEPALKLGWSVPRVRRDYTRSPLLAVPAYVLLARMRRPPPPRGRALRRADGPPQARYARARRSDRRGRRRAVRVDGRRRRPHPRSGGDGRHRRDHERPAVVRLTSRTSRWGEGVMNCGGRS